ncbi:MAG: methyltransferase regulatory domain-containing protein, partial [Burkholderiales bacterium]
MRDRKPQGRSRAPESRAAKSAREAAPPDFITDLQYTSDFYPHLAPSWMNYIAAINGYPPRQLEGRFNYCELGCGQGFTAVVLAAANPAGRFFGVDANAEHVANARRLASACEVRNAVFMPCTIAQALDEDLPSFDFIALHGVWSWVGEEARDDILRFVAQKLNPGGIVSNSYNALPGWATILPLREMMVAYGDHKGGSTVERLRHGLAYVKFMAQTGAKYFERNPLAARKLEELLRSDARYLAHEYLTPHWKPEYFSAVARRFKAAGLSFCGTYPPESNYSDLCIPQPFRGFLGTAPDRETFEIHRDFVVDTRFRIDYFVRLPPAPRPDPFPASLRDRFFFTLVSAPEQARAAVQVAGVRMEMAGRLVEPLVEALAEGPVTGAALMARLGSGFAELDVMRGLQYLVLGRHVVPGARAPARGRPQPFSTANRELLARAFAQPTDQAVLASTVSGGGLQFRTFDALALAGVLHAGKGEAVGWCLDFMHARG